MSGGPVASGRDIWNVAAFCTAEKKIMFESVTSLDVLYVVSWILVLPPCSSAVYDIQVSAVNSQLDYVVAGKNKVPRSDEALLSC